MSGHSVLIVEDELLIAMSLEDFLVDEGHSVAGIAHSLSSAFTALQEGKFEIAKLDIDLGNELVWPFARQLQADNIGYFFLSSDCARGDFPAECRSADQLCKPFRDDQVRACLAKFSAARAA